MEAPAAESSNNPNTNNGGGAEDEGNAGGRFSWRLVSLLAVRSAAEKVAQIARDDPRRVAHSLKVGLALTLVSVVYYVTPLFNGFGGSAMWAVLTVVIVMEFTVGATLSKGLNRALATLVASSLAIGAHEVASLVVPSEKAESILLVVFVFFVGNYSMVTTTSAINVTCLLTLMVWPVRRCSVGSDLLTVHPGDQGEVRLRCQYIHTHLQPRRRLQLPRRGAHAPRAPAHHHHLGRRRHLPLHHNLDLPGLGRRGPAQARSQQPGQAGRVPRRYDALFIRLNKMASN